MDEANNFIKKAEDKLISSKTLYNIGQYSTSVSTSYYSMFLCAKALVVKEGYNPKSHNGTISLFSEVCVHNGKFNYEIYKYLTGTQSLRNDADYNAIDEITSQIAKQKIRQAEVFIEETKKFL